MTGKKSEDMYGVYIRKVTDSSSSKLPLAHVMCMCGGLDSYMCVCVSLFLCIHAHVYLPYR